MYALQKSIKLNHVRYDVRGRVAAEAEKLAGQGIDILKLNIGNPAHFGFEAPELIRKSVTEKLSQAVAYSDSRGLLSARLAIADYCKAKKIPNVSPDDVYTGNGVSELIAITMQGLLNHGDEILVPAPDYPLWTAAVTVAGGTAVHYICDEQAEWNPDISDIKKKITARTKGLVIINPNNPTGALYPREILEQIVEIARQNRLIIFADEIYDRLVMDGHEHISVASLAPDLLVVTMNGLSKSHIICGFRCGWMSLSGDKTGAQDYIDGLTLLSSMRLCSNVPSQLAIEEALKSSGGTDASLLPGGRLYEQRNYITEALNSIPGVSAVKPKGALYIFPRLDAGRFHIKDDEKFALDFLRDKHVLMVHGTGFNWKQPDHFRIVYLPEINVLKTAMDSLGDFLTYYRQ
ncbi:MAG: pyridoxal phosphate-dependent aminotransferase [Clostridiales bacterium]|nr:pyridoxal phosphate-dependent aminotransferase [Clostridiales bacterium]